MLMVVLLNKILINFMFVNFTQNLVYLSQYNFILVVNLAASLKIIKPNISIGLLDADVFGPSVPLMMNLKEAPLLDENNMMIPLTNYGIQW